LTSEIRRIVAEGFSGPCRARQRRFGSIESARAI
jgi:hypothetical protein